MLEPPPVGKIVTQGRSSLVGTLLLYIQYTHKTGDSEGWTGEFVVGQLGHLSISRAGLEDGRRSMEAVVEAPRVIAVDDWLVIMQVHARNGPMASSITLSCRGPTARPLVPSPFFPIMWVW